MFLNKPLVDKAFKSNHHGVHQEIGLPFCGRVLNEISE